MLNVVKGSLFKSFAQTLVNTVNCAWAMGKGIALEFKNRYPAMFKDYRQRCKQDDVRIGIPYLYTGNPTHWILNFPTKQHWRGKTELSYVTSGLSFLSDHYRDWAITSIAFPLLGANLGGLDKSVVLRTMKEYLAEFTIPVEIYILGDDYLENMA